MISVFNELAPITECKVEIVPINGGKDAILKESPPGSGKYDIVVEPAQFDLFVKKVGYLVHKERISTSAGIFEQRCELQKARN